MMSFHISFFLISTSTAAVPLQQPRISLSSPNRELVWGPGGAEVTRGNRFGLTCSINSSYSEGRFFVIFSGSNLTNSKPAVNHSATFDFPVADYEHAGNYSCVYEVTLSSRRFTSTQKESIRLTIKMPLLPVVSSVVAGGLVLLLLVLVVVCLVYKRRRRALQPGSPIQTQSLFSQDLQLLFVNFHLVNDYDDDVPEDEEADYVNVDPVNNKEKAGAAEEEYSDYESDEDHDYEEAGHGPNLIKAKEILFSEQENGQEEEEESSDDEADYENVSLSFVEETVDIYGQDENIYQNI
ncbi:uncharacterized protein LOC131983355 [Centropristis striata]|uniref:uncharacterized protein LOC131983355 n=1 Tax=Centropristis striata TaxID=184440 RepID=UPI0027DFF281|nr:uncharacterized protein LOC131983355 [Centropristis striata]